VFTSKDIDGLKPSYVTMLVNTVLRESGLSPRKPRKKAFEDKEDEFGKNSEESGRK